MIARPGRTARGRFRVAKLGFCVSRRLDPGSGAAWTKFVEGSGLAHLKEVVGLDCSLCPRALDELTDADDAHLVHSHELFAVFDTPEYALSRSPLDRRTQLLALMREPTAEDLDAVVPEGFAFQGFDLIEEATEVSALTHCGGFPLAFAPADLSPTGLVVGRNAAFRIRARLAEAYPDEAHAECAVWAIWRLEESGARN